MDSLTMDNVEQLTLAELRELQTKRLKQTLTFVYENSPVYKKKFDEAGVHPDD
ncbi:phenylacetate--CoA ligase, partial [Acinetobacter baumannii]